MSNLFLQNQVEVLVSVDFTLSVFVKADCLRIFDAPEENKLVSGLSVSLSSFGKHHRTLRQCISRIPLKIHSCCIILTKTHMVTKWVIPVSKVQIPEHTIWLN